MNRGIGFYSSLTLVFASVVGLVYVDQYYIEYEKSDDIYQVGSITPNPKHDDRVIVTPSAHYNPSRQYHYTSPIPNEFRMSAESVADLDAGDCVQPIFLGVTSNLFGAQFDSWRAAELEIVPCEIPPPPEDPSQG